MADLVGKTLKNRYKVVESLGRGGMADVYKVWDEERAVYLAMKVLRQDLAQDPIFLRRFQREAKALAGLQHPHIVRFYGLERDDLLAFLLMEYVDGISLQGEILRSEGKPLPMEHIQEVMQAVCSALHYAHHQGLVHCDIKPGNILIDKHGQIYLTDFGIARGMDAATSTMVGIGTPAYMAPELIKGEDPTAQTDIYALGIVLYEMLTGGERPFTGERATITGTTADKVRWEHLKLEPTPMSSFNPEITPELEKVVMRCLEKDLENRFHHVQDILFSLEQAMHIQPSVMKEESNATGRPSKQPAIRSFEEERKVKQEIKRSVQSITSPEQPRQKRKIIFSGLGWLLAGLFVVISVVFYIQRVPTAEVIAPPTSTISPTNTIYPTLTATPALGVGSTIVSSKDGMILMYVPEGEFIMGSEDGDSDESPEHTVYLDAFWIGSTEVTNAQYRLCFDAGICSYPNINSSATRGIYFNNSMYENYPVIGIDWYQAKEYCEWAGKRLPTEAEWEKAARGTDGLAYPWGEKSSNADLANYNGNVGDTTEVGSYPAGASPYGALDMAGNVWEWVADWYDGSYYDSSPLENPQGPASGGYRVVRGGSWIYTEWRLRTANRNYLDLDDSNGDIGFRCALSTDF